MTAYWDPGYLKEVAKFHQPRHNILSMMSTDEHRKNTNISCERETLTDIKNRAKTAWLRRENTVTSYDVGSMYTV